VRRQVVQVVDEEQAARLLQRVREAAREHVEGALGAGGQRGSAVAVFAVKVGGAQVA
jgi:hypothetical protein